ncbi:hypothetical protein RRF57_000128 [Xylaria bambusicola]|uniref:Acyl-CoA thioesterase-like N-terminal HotDog domain-containing protein n=1 Tax=Xylaria bambusicola TaxID=326684 RepID=A0AAN7Z0E5_9PEZI
MATILISQIDLRNPAPGTYTAAWYIDWTCSIVDVLHHATETHLTTDSVMNAKNQPDIANLHIEFLRPCIRQDSTITITVLRTGAATSTVQLQLAQEGQVRVIALATAINFDRVLGPTPTPDFDGVLAHQPDPNWIALRVSGEIIPFTCRILVLNPCNSFQYDSICDAWNSMENDRIDATYLTMMTDIIPAEKSPGAPAAIPNTATEAMKSSTFTNTVTLGIEFTKRVSGDARPRFIFTRTAANLL